MKKRKIISKNGGISLIHQIRDHKSWSEIQVTFMLSIKEHEMVAYLGKSVSRSQLVWRIWNRAEAEQKFMYSSLRWT